MNAQKVIDKSYEQILIMARAGMSAADIIEVTALAPEIVHAALGGSDDNEVLVQEMNGLIRGIARDPQAPSAVRLKAAVDQRDEVLGRNEKKANGARLGAIGLFALNDQLEAMQRARPIKPDPKVIELSTAATATATAPKEANV